MIFARKVTSMKNMLKIIMIIMDIKMILNRRNFMVELINYLLNYAMIIAVNAMN